MRKYRLQNFLFSIFYFLFSRRRGFTLIEVLVAVSITIFLSSALILYNSQSRSQTALYVEQGKVAQIILRAKSLAISTYTKENNCGYGVHFDYDKMPAEYNLFAYGGAGVNCATISVDGIDPGKETPVDGAQAFQIGSTLVFGAGENRLTDILFIPPDPETVIVAEGSSLPVPSGVVYLQTKDGLANVAVKVGAAGQITF